MNNNSNESMATGELIWQAYETSLDPFASPSDRSDATRVCDDFKSNPEVCVPFALEWARQEDPKARFFGLHCIEHVIKYRWTKLSPDFQRGLRAAVKSLLLNAPREQYLSTMLSRCLSQIIERDWPHNWPDMLADLEQMGEVAALRIFLEEVFLYDSIPVAKRRELSSAVQQQLLPVLFPQLLSALYQQASGDGSGASLLLSVLYPIAHLARCSPDLLLALSRYLSGAGENAEMALGCIQRVLKSGRKNIQAVQVLGPLLLQMQPTHGDMVSMNVAASLLRDLYAFSPVETVAIPIPVGQLCTFLSSEEFALTKTDLYFDLMNILVSPGVYELWDAGVEPVLRLCCELCSRQQVDRDTDMDEHRNIARIRNVGNKLMSTLFTFKPDMFGEFFLNAMGYGQWQTATFMLQSIASEKEEAVNKLVGELVSSVFNSGRPFLPSTQFIQLSFPRCPSEIRDCMLAQLLSDEANEKELMSVVLALSRLDLTRPFLASRLPKLLQRLSTIRDCLAVSILAEAVLLLIKDDWSGGQQGVLDMILEPCSRMFLNEGSSDNGETQDQRHAQSVALHLLVSTARSVADTEVGREKLIPYFPALRKLITGQTPLDTTVATKVIEFIGVFVDAGLLSSTGPPILDEEFARLAMQFLGCWDVMRSLVRQVVLPLAGCPSENTRAFIDFVLLNIPEYIANAYGSIEPDLPPAEDIERRGVLALLSRDVVDVYRRVCMCPANSPALNLHSPALVANCFQMLYMLCDSLAVQRLVPVCASFLASSDLLSPDMEMPALLCLLRSLQQFWHTDKDVLAHDLLVMSSRVLDRIIRRSGVEGCWALLRDQVSAEIAREDVRTYFDSIASFAVLGADNLVHDKQRKRCAETLVRKVFEQKPAVNNR